MFCLTCWERLRTNDQRNSLEHVPTASNACRIASDQRRMGVQPRAIPRSKPVGVTRWTRTRSSLQAATSRRGNNGSTMNKQISTSQGNEKNRLVSYPLPCNMFGQGCCVWSSLLQFVVSKRLYLVKQVGCLLLDEQVRFQMIVLSKLCFGAGTGKDMSTSIIQDLSTSTSNGVFATRPL